MEENKMLDYAKDLREDIDHAISQGDELIVSRKDEKVIDWLIQHAKRAEMYKQALLFIGAKHKPPASLTANMALFEADQRFNDL